jgi:hypothetical protein
MRSLYSDDKEKHIYKINMVIHKVKKHKLLGNYKSCTFLTNWRRKNFRNVAHSWIVTLNHGWLNLKVPSDCVVHQYFWLIFWMCLSSLLAPNHSILDTDSICFCKWQDKIRNPTQLGPLEDLVLNPGLAMLNSPVE